MKGPQLPLLFAACVALFCGCAAGTSLPTASSTHVVYVTSLEKSATPIPDVLSAIDAATGKLLWRFHPANLNITATVPGRDVIYVGVTDHNVYALAKGSGQVRWRAPVGGYPNVETVVDDIVIVMASTYVDSAEYNVVYALNAGDGKALWHTDLQQGVVRATAAGKVYVETGGQNEPAIIAFDLRTGQPLWQYVLGRNGVQWQLLDGQIYIQTSPSQDPVTSVCFVVSASTGKLLWRFPSTGEAVIFWLLEGDGNVYVEDGSDQSTGAQISALDAASGVLKWQKQAPANGEALVGTGNGSLYAIAETYLVALRGEDGSELWRSTVGAGVAGTAGSEFVAVPGAVYAAITGLGLVKFNASDGSQAWHVPIDDPSGFVLYAVNQGVLYAGQRLRYQIIAFDTATGEVRWRYNVVGSIASVNFG